jgi:hypothetical protein
LVRQAFDSLASRKAIRIFVEKVGLARSSVGLDQVIGCAVRSPDELIPGHATRMVYRAVWVGLVDAIAEPNSSLMQRENPFAALGGFFHAPMKCKSQTVGH